MSTNEFNKQRVLEFWRLLEGPDMDREMKVGPYLSDRLSFHGPDPFNELQGSQAYLTHFWGPLRRSFQDLKRESFIFMGGRSNGRLDGDATQDGHMWVGGTGLMHGTFDADYVGIPASHGRVQIRWGEFCRVADGRIDAIYCLLDLVDLLRQAGVLVLPPSRGVDGLYPPPRAGDGVRTGPQDEQETLRSLEHIRQFIFAGLNRYDESDLKSMGMAHFFSPQVQWYGPGGIGACLSFRQFEDLHQRPWLTAFPDRRVQDLTALVAEGPYTGSPGWHGVIATHSGEYLGCPATHRRVTINGMDWWKRKGEQYIENWVFVDMIHLFRQFGVDLLSRVAHAYQRDPDQS